MRSIEEIAELLSSIFHNASFDAITKKLADRFGFCNDFDLKYCEEFIHLAFEVVAKWEKRDFTDDEEAELIEWLEEMLDDTEYSVKSSNISWFQLTDTGQKRWNEGAFRAPGCDSDATGSVASDMIEVRKKVITVHKSNMDHYYSLGKPS